MAAASMVLLTAAPAVNSESGASVLSAKVTTIPAHWVRMCNEYQRVTERTIWSALAFVRNDWWGQRGCITTNTTAPDNFRVSSSYNWHGPVLAFPETHRGCAYSVCTPKPGFPVRADRAGNSVVRWMTRGPVAAGSYNAALDLWFNRTLDYSGHPNGTEIMIWPYRHGLCCSLHGAVKVRVVNRTWWLEHWRTCQTLPVPVCWNYVQFRLVKPAGSFRWLKLTPFLAKAERIGAMSRHWWWTSADAGFEIWSGGRGLASTSFYIRS